MEGAAVGTTVGAFDGVEVGLALAVGDKVGENDGRGLDVGEADGCGDAVGDREGRNDKEGWIETVGLFEGSTVGTPVGALVCGALVGITVGRVVEKRVGVAVVGLFDRPKVGKDVGDDVIRTGAFVGSCAREEHNVKNNTDNTNMMRQFECRIFCRDLKFGVIGLLVSCRNRPRSSSSIGNL